MVGVQRVVLQVIRRAVGHSFYATGHWVGLREDLYLVLGSFDRAGRWAAGFSVEAEQSLCDRIMWLFVGRAFRRGERSRPATTPASRQGRRRSLPPRVLLERAPRLMAGSRIVWTLLGGVLVTGLLVAYPVHATHGVDHRYVVLGYFRNGDGRPIPRRPVQFIREKTGLAYRAETNAEGFYALIIHLHDEDVLDPLQVAASGARIRIEARFNPLNPQRPRGTRVDFAGGQAREHQEMFAETLEEYLRR